MCPFLDDENDYPMESPPVHDSEGGFRSNFFRNDKKFFLIGGGVSIATFCIIAYVMYSSSKPIDLEELPVIHADPAPFKVKPVANEQVKHQDKMVYDNISGNKRKVEEKIAQPPEEVLSIPEIDGGETLSDEEKKNIIQAFDELAPEKEYKINYVKKDAPIVKSDNLIIVENKYRTPIHRIEDSSPAIKKPKQRLRDLMGTTNEIVASPEVSSGGNVMVQIASVTTKSAAEVEYSRLLLKNNFLKGMGKKIIKVDLGEKKGIRYRIQVGPFKARGDANKIVSMMRKNGFSAYISK
ncbi:MAG: SPOR domain-containing protein [Holosporaceae bacterium]|jgi:hypothetical protein|nr:SPOR domain-containing protein [Holosporaceae bacterium]